MAVNPECPPKDTLYTITDIYPDHVVLDGNHPLAGIAIRISLHVESVREATEEESGRGSCGTGFFKLQVAHPDADERPTTPCTEISQEIALKPA
jgi:FKBP-type peptidyl-prolyl cis-trans isomerase SlyD